MFRLSRFILLLFLISLNVLSVELHRYATAASGMAAQIQHSDVAIDSSGNIYHMVVENNSHNIKITKTSSSDGALVTSFGVNGVRTLSLNNSESASTDSAINMLTYSSLDSTSKMFMQIDALDRIVIFFMINVLVGKHAASLRLTSNGALDTAYGNTTSKVAAIGYNSTVTLEAAAIDSSNRTISVLYDTSFPRASVQRFDAIGDNYDVQTIQITNMTPKMAVVPTDTYIMLFGIYGTSPNCGIYGAQLNATTMLQTTTGNFSTGAYQIITTGLDQDTNIVAVKNFGAEDISFGALINLFYIAPINKTILQHRVLLADTSGINANRTGTLFTNDATLTGAAARANGQFYISGKVISGGPEVPFVGRVTSSGGTIVGDTGFAASGNDNYINNGIVKIPATDNSFTLNTQKNVHLAYRSTSPGTVAVGFTEMGPSQQLVRAFGTESGDNFLTAPNPVVTPAAVSAPVSVVAGQARKDQAFTHLSLSASNLTTIDDSGLVVTQHDDTISYVRSGNFYIFSKIKEDGTLDTSFNTNGHSKITLAASGASTTTAVISSFSSVVSAEKSFITYDPINNSIVVQFKVNVGGSTQIGVFKVKADTGLLDTTFGVGGSSVTTVSATTNTQKPQGVLVDSSGKVIFFVHYTYSDGEKRVHVNKTNLTGGDIEFTTSFRPVNDMPETGFDGSLDYLGNIYVAGQHVNGGSRGLFCARLNSNGILDTAFAVGGIYTTPTLSELDGVTTGAFLSIYEYDNTRNLQIVAKGTSSSLPGVVIQQLNISDGSVDTTFGTSGKAFVQLSNLTTLNQAKRNEEGYLFCSGKITELAVVKSFLARITKAGVLDTTFGDTSDSMKLGIAKIEATSTWTIQDGGYFSFDSGSSCLFVSSESKNSERQLIVQRIAGTNDLDFDINIIDNGTDLISFILAHHFNTKNGLLGFIHLDGIANDLQKTWTAVGGVVDAAAISAGISAFKTAVGTALERVLALATLNNHGSCLSITHKPGSIKKTVSEAVKAVVTTNQYTAMTAALDSALDTISARLNLGRKNTTGNERKKQITLD